MKPVTVIIPTYNERENIIPLLDAINKEFAPQEIIIIDDNSPDGTAEEVIKQQIKFPNVKVIKNILPLGLSRSIQKGINESQGKCIAWMDADFSHPPKMLNKLYERTNQADIVIGSWLTLGGRDKRKEKLIVLFSLIINKLCQILFDYRVRAYTSGFVMTQKSLFKDFKLREDYGEYFIDFVVRNIRRGKTIVEIPFDCISRRKGASKTAPSLYRFILRGRKYLITILSLVLRSWTPS